MEALIAAVIAEGVVIVGLAVALIIAIKKNGRPGSKADNVRIIDGVRYTTDKLEYGEDGQPAVTHRKGDILLERGKTYTVRLGGKIIPGKYTVLTGSENTDKFNLRIGGIAREYSHAEDIVLADGEEICAVSHAVILR